VKLSYAQMAQRCKERQQDSIVNCDTTITVDTVSCTLREQQQQQQLTDVRTPTRSKKSSSSNVTAVVASVGRRASKENRYCDEVTSQRQRSIEMRK
jgi:hypothetical protein